MSYSSLELLKSLKVTQTTQAVSTANYTVKYMCGGVEVKDADATRSGVVDGEINLTSSDKATFYNDGRTKKYIYVSDDASSKTIADDGSTVVTVTFREAEAWGYTVNAMNGGSKIEEVTTGNTFEQENVTVPFHKYYNINGTLYQKAAISSEYRQVITVDEDDKVVELAYTASDKTNVVFFKEAENIATLTAVSGGGTTTRCSFAQGAYATEDALVTTLTPGKYILTGAGYGGNLVFKVGETEILNMATAGYWREEASEIFAITETANITFNGGASGGGASLDYVIIQKVGGANTLTSGNATHLTFDNATTGSNAWDNWIIDVYNGGSKVAKVRADWWDDIASSNTGFTYGYTYSSDGGTTADNTNWATTFVSDMADADVDLTLSYTDGSLHIIGTMTKGDKVYYVNYTKSGLEGDVSFDLYGNNATLSNITTATASAVTTPAHPTNVAVTMGSNGYATYANNVYPLDLTSAPAYKAAVAGSKVNFTLFGQAVPANTGMLVKGTANGTVNLPIADASTAVAGNDFLVNASGATFEAAANTTYYAMIKNSDPLTFGTFAPGTLAFPANKAYLTVVTGGAPSLIAIFDGGQTTGIDAVKGSEFTVDGEYYNLAGQRVAQPTKGLYIVNGKKVVVK